MCLRAGSTEPEGLEEDAHVPVPQWAEHHWKEGSAIQGMPGLCRHLPYSDSNAQVLDTKGKRDFQVLERHSDFRIKILFYKHTKYFCNKIIKTKGLRPTYWLSEGLCVTTVMMVTGAPFYFFLIWNWVEGETSYNVWSYLKTEPPEIKISKNTEFNRVSLRIWAPVTMNKQRQGWDLWLISSSTQKRNKKLNMYKHAILTIKLNNTSLILLQ